MNEQTIGHYRILGKIGGGGMGVVYEAEDTKLGRRVALKFLPEEAQRDAASRERLFREARAASALNHPNIFTIHAIEEQDGRTYLVMELLEGQSLDRMLAAQPLPIPAAIAATIELADALDAAHKKGILHRDIKPANVFLTQRGPVKILDFGLAKLLSERETSDSGVTMMDSSPLHLTSPGTAVGTVAYMSPEQARGQELDGRSDLFSLGAVLYQMVTGRQPFPGSTSAVIFDNILHHPPVAPVTLNPEVPPELERILNKALEKDRDMRYQVAAEMRADLKRLQRELDPSRTLSSQKSAARVAPAAPSGMSPAPAGSSGRVLVEAARQNKLRTGLALGIAALVLVAAGFGIYSLVQRTRHLPFEHFSVENLTNNGHVLRSTISPDGKYLLHALEENGLQSLWLRHIPTGSNTQVVPPLATSYAGLTFSPDGNYVYFVRRDEAEHIIATLYRAPVLGGTPQLLIHDVDSPISFSPDGQHFVYIRQDHDTPRFDVLIAHADGSPERTPVSKMILLSDSRVPAWSPDGKVIVIPIVQPARDALGGFVAIDALTGKQQIAAVAADRNYLTPAWLPDSSGLIVAAAWAELGLVGPQLGLVSYPAGEFRRLTTDTNSYFNPSVASDGRSFAANQDQRKFELSVAALESPDTLKPVPLSSRLFVQSWDWMPDGRLVVSQGSDIRLVSLNGGESLVLSDPKHPANQLASCADGRYVVFRPLGRSGGMKVNLWRVDVAGTNATPLTSGTIEGDPRCSRDGKWLYYADPESLKRVPLGGGTPETLINAPIATYALSPDGKTFVTYEVRDFDHKLMLVLYSIEDKKKVYQEWDQRASPDVLELLPDGKAVSYLVREKGVDNIWVQPLDGSPRSQLTRFTSERILGVNYSPDGSKMAILRGHTESDAVLFRDTSR